MMIRFCPLYEKVVSYLTCIHKEQLDESQTRELQDYVSKGRSESRQKSVIHYYVAIYINLTENSILVNSYLSTGLHIRM